VDFQLITEMQFYAADTAGSNVYTQLFVGLFNAMMEKDSDRVTQFHAEVMRFGESKYHSAQYDANPLRGLKCALKRMGVCEGGLTEPQAPY
jgi:4-hydroxy-tetrahydrodipicolinate synthase